MSNIYATVSDILVDQILPEDTDKNNRTWLAPSKLNLDEFFTALVDQFMADSQGNRKRTPSIHVRRHWELLLNLSQAVFQRRWQFSTGRTQKKLRIFR